MKFQANAVKQSNMSTVDFLFICFQASCDQVSDLFPSSLLPFGFQKNDTFPRIARKRAKATVHFEAGHTVIERSCERYDCPPDLLSSTKRIALDMACLVVANHTVLSLSDHK